MTIDIDDFRQRLKALLVIACLFAFISRAEAVEQIFACTLLPGSSGLLISEADQMAIDVENQTVDLRVAGTMGTAMPEDWRFGPGTTASNDHSFSVRKMGTSIIGAGVRDAAAHAFELESGILTWTMVMMHESMTMSWRCSEYLGQPRS